MEQSTILKYAQRYLSDKMERLLENIDSERVSPFQKGKFKENLKKYKAEYEEVSKQLSELKK